MAQNISDLRKFALSWKENSELKSFFWTVFALTLIGLFIPIAGLVISLYVLLEYFINKVLFSVLTSLGYSPKKIKVLEFINLLVIGFLGVLLPWWSGIYFLIQILVIVFLIISLVFMQMFLLSMVLFVILFIMILHNTIRLSLIFSIFLNSEEKKITDTIKESWRMTEGKVIRVLTYYLKGLWYLILKVWPLILAMIILTVILILILKYNALFIILMIFYLLSAYINTVSYYIGQFIQAAVYDELKKMA